MGDGYSADTASVAQLEARGTVNSEVTGLSPVGSKTAEAHSLVDCYFLFM